MNIKTKIENWLKELIISSIKSAKIEERVGSAIEKLRYDYLPHGACWMCSMPVSRGKGYSMWRGRMFCSEQCLEKYSGLIAKPDEDYKIIDGDIVEKFNPK